MDNIGEFHHGMQEALWHMAMAHFRDLWVVVGKVKKLEDLRRFTPEKLKTIATKIVIEHASSNALLKYRAAEHQDRVFIDGVQFALTATRVPTQFRRILKHTKA